MLIVVELLDDVRRDVAPGWLGMEGSHPSPSYARRRLVGTGQARAALPVSPARQPFEVVGRE